MKWFKHYSTSLQSESLSNLVRDTGLIGYARYWILLEHLAGIFDGESDEFRVPIDNVRAMFRIRSWNELETFTERLANVRGLFIKRNGNVFEIKAPILLELKDKDFKKSRHIRGTSGLKIKSKDKDKEEDKEVGENANSESNLHPMILLWNSAALNLGKVIKSNSARDRKIKKLWPQNSPDEWLKIIQRINQSDFCIGKNDRSWKATFDWLLQPEVYLKVLEGKYDNRSKPSSKRFAFERDDKEVVDEFNAIANGIDPATGKSLG